MSDLLDKAHADAGLNLLHAVMDPIPIAVYDGVVPNPFPDVKTSPYVMVYVSIERPVTGAGNALDGRSATYVIRWYVHSVAGSGAGARAVAMQARTALLDVRPTIAGRACGLIRWVDGQPAGPDEVLGYPVVDKVDVYELTTTG